ncbi:MAG: zinc ribbon domain-containing protein [Candidatus Omnitrophica bacterium]|nr:zinc ribbon domain-containing protein [Candidatus Omnitrophota bacterium]
MMTRYHCTHCGRSFEAEEKENMECPSCFWSTTVKKESELEESRQVSNLSQKSPSEKKSVRIPFSFKPVGVGIGLFLIFFLMLHHGVPFLLSSFNKVKNRMTSEFSSKDKRVIRGPGEEQNKIEASGKLNAQEMLFLKRRTDFQADRAVSEEEEKILSHHVQFRTGFSQKLSSQPWSLQNFKNFLAEQERFYQMPLPRSYRGKLDDLFEQKYLPGKEAFEKGNLIQARNLWVESLVFPIYAEDIQKHRGVILTMLRPFIQDTLSKIGALNGMMVEKKIRDQETMLGEGYEELLSLLSRHLWLESLDKITQLTVILESLEKPNVLVEASPPYPSSVTQIDPDIQRTLMDLLEPGIPAVTDIGVLRRDLESKRLVAESFSEPVLSEIEGTYQDAMDAIDRGEWDEAERLFSGIRSPLALKEEAQKKVALIRKIRQS